MLEVEVTDKIIQLEFYNGYVDGIILELKKKEVQILLLGHYPTPSLVGKRNGQKANRSLNQQYITLRASEWSLLLGNVRRKRSKFFLDVLQKGTPDNFHLLLTVYPSQVELGVWL